MSFFSPTIPTTSPGVISCIFALSFNSCTFSTESNAPRNSLRLCTKVTLEATSVKKILQSSAESPPPAMTTSLSLYNSGSLMIYSTPLSSKSAIFGMGGFLGSKLPSPPAIATIGAWCFVPLLVVTIKVPSSSVCML